MNPLLPVVAYLLVSACAFVATWSKVGAPGYDTASRVADGRGELVGLLAFYVVAAGLITVWPAFLAGRLWTAAKHR